MYERLRHGAASPVFVDSSAVVAYFHERDRHHDDAQEFFRGIRDDELRARPLYTSEYVVDEAGTTLLGRAGHQRGARAVEYLLESTAVQVLHVDPSTFDRAAERFVEHDDQNASFTDHVLGVQADERGVELVLTFDGDFEALGLTTLPEYPGT